MWDSSKILIAAADQPGGDSSEATEGTQNPIETISETFHLNWELFIPQVIVFGIVIVVLKQFAFGPIQKMLAERSQMIAESHENSLKIKTELAEAAATRKQIIEEASAQANKIIEEARQAANQVQETETQKAASAAEEIISKARVAAESDRDQLLDDLRKEVGQLVVQTTTQVVGKVLSDSDKKRLVDEANKSIAA